DRLMKDLRDSSSASAEALARAKADQAKAQDAATKAATALNDAIPKQTDLNNDATARAASEKTMQDNFAPVRSTWETLTGDDSGLVRGAAEGAAGNSADGATVMQSIIDWVDNQYTSPGFDTAGRGARLKATATYLKGLKTQPAITNISIADRKIVF